MAACLQMKYSVKFSHDWMGECEGSEMNPWDSENEEFIMET